MLDAFGNVATGYAGTVHFSSTDKKAGLPDDYTFVAANHGVKTVQATFKTAGSQTITISDVAAPHGDPGRQRQPLSVSPREPGSWIYSSSSNQRLVPREWAC